MRRRTDMPAVRLVFAAILSLALFFTYLASGVLALSSDVSVTVPEGIIAVHGTTSPHAQVKIYENGNSTPAVSLIANSSGDFSEELPQMATGIVTIDIRATDTNGVMTPAFSRQVAVLSHQTSVLNVLLPPSVTAEPSSIVFGNGSLNFVGRTAPDALVRVIIEPSATSLTTTADAKGDFSIPLSAGSLKTAGVYAYSIETEKGDIKSDRTVAGTFAIAPPANKPAPKPRPPFFGITRFSISRPVITPFSTDQDKATSEPVIITGAADPSAVIILYEDNQPIGSVVADAEGVWQFYFVPYKEMHTLYAKACKGDKCSELSRPITIKGPSKELKACQLLLKLQSLRLTGKAGGSVELRGTVADAASGLVAISWGEKATEQFDLPSDGELKVTHTYQEAGIYSGFVILNNGTSCQTITHFTAEIVGPASLEPISRAAGIAVLALIVVTWIFLKALPALKGRAFIKK